MRRFIGRTHGFTLIEILVVLAIIGLLAGVAIPAYQTKMLKMKRSDAHIPLTDIVALQEKYFFQNNRYSDNIVELYGSNKTPEEAYEISIDTSACNTGRCFELIATAVDGQAKDKTCAKMSIDHVGLKSAQNAGGTDTTTSCW